jgi:cytosine/adenosine deaminase-related metal-dependent hydrolase
MNTLITNVQIITQETPNRVLTGQAVAVEGAWIKAVGTEGELRQHLADFTVLDGRGRVLMPGLINAHNHFYGLYARGLALTRPMANFHEILRYLWWTLDKSLDEEAVYYSALVPAISSIKHGVTTVIDHHASPNAVDGSLDQIEQAMRQVGLRGILCYEVSDRDGKAVREAGLRENERYIQKCRAARAADPAHLFDGLMGLHASFTVDDATLESAAAICQSLERGVHIHVQEDWVDNDRRAVWAWAVGSPV